LRRASSCLFKASAASCAAFSAANLASSASLALLSSFILIHLIK